jgi:predicted dinucleotide-binding enzyme
MRYDLNSARMFGCVVLALAVPAAAVPAVAEEAGQWFGRAVLVTLSSKSVKVEDRADHTVSVTEFDGACSMPTASPSSTKPAIRWLI